MATCVWCGWLHPCRCHLHLFFPLSLPTFGIIIVVDVVVQVVVPMCCLMWWCTHNSAHLEYFFLLKLFQPALNPSHDIGWNQRFLTSTCISTHATTNTNGKWPPSPLFQTPTPGMKAGGWRCRWMNRGAWEASASQASGKFLFFILFFCSTNNFFYN